MGGSLKARTPVLTSSRLSKTLHEVLHDRDALPYLLQFLSSRGCSHYLQFYLDAQSFQAATQSRLQSQGVGQADDQGGGGATEAARPKDLPLCQPHSAKMNSSAVHNPGPLEAPPPPSLQFPGANEPNQKNPSNSHPTELQCGAIDSDQGHSEDIKSESNEGGEETEAENAGMSPSSIKEKLRKCEQITFWPLLLIITRGEIYIMWRFKN